MKRAISNFLILVFILGSFEAVAKKATTIKTQDDDGNEITRTKCTSHDQCSDPAEGCYEADSDEFEGADWWTKMWRRENGKTCSSDKQCDSGNCDDFNETDGTDDKGNTKWKVVQRCGPLSVCKEAEYGDSIKDAGAECSDGLMADLDGKCISADMFDLDDSLNENGATQPGIDMKSCSVYIPTNYTLSYRYNTMLIQLLTFIFGDVSNADCIGVTPGIQHIAKAIEAAQVAYGKKVVEGLKLQEAYFNANVKDASDATKKSSIDTYNASLEIMRMNQESYIEANNILKKAYDDALMDLGTLQTFYSSYDWKHDPVGKQAPQNNSARYTLISGGGFSWNIGSSLDARKHFCRGRSPKLKRAFSRRYRVFDGTHNGLAQYLNLTYSNLAEDRQRYDYSKDDGFNNKSKGKKKHSNEKAYFLLDPPLPVIRSGVDFGGNIFKAFGTSGSTRNNDNDGESRARMSKDLVEYMLDLYLLEMYRVFKDKPEFLAVAASNTSGTSTPAVNLVGVTDSDKAKVNQFYEEMKTFMVWRKNDKKYWDQDHKDEGKDWKNNRNDIMTQHWHVTHNNHVDADPARYFLKGKTKVFKMDPQLRTLLEKTLAMGLSEGGKKSVLKFHMLMHDLRQRFYQVIFLYSAGRTKTYPNQMRNVFWGVFQSAFNSNLKYLNELNELGHNKSKECLVKLKAQWQEQTDNEDDEINLSSTEYNENKKKDKTTKGELTKYDTTKCTGGKCGSSLGGATIGIPMSGAKGARDGAAGSGAGGNFEGGNVASGSVGQGAITNIRKKKEEAFNKKATPAMKAARAANNRFLKMALTPPAAVGGGESAPATASSGGGGDSSPTNTTEKPTEAPIVAVNSPANIGAPSSPMNNVSIDDSGSSRDNHTEIPPEHAEAMLNEVKDDKYKTDEDDGIFIKITKTYMRAGLPRLLTKKADLKTQDHHEKEAFDPTVKKKKPETLH